MTRALIAKIHIAKKDLALDDETYRAILERVTKKRSCAGLRGHQLVAILDEFKALGWKPKKATFKKAKNGQVAKIYALWGVLAEGGVVRSRTPAAVAAYVKRLTGVDNPEWLPPQEARAVIESLKKWINRVGLEGDLK